MNGFGLFNVLFGMVLIIGVMLGLMFSPLIIQVTDLVSAVLLLNIPVVIMLAFYWGRIGKLEDKLKEFDV